MADEESKVLPRGYAQTESSTSWVLQLCLEYNACMSLLFLVVESAVLSEKLTRFELDVFGQVLAPLTFGVWAASEVFRLWFGYTGNLQEKLPQMSVFFLLSLFPQLPCLLYLMRLQDLQLPFERAMGGMLFAIVCVELVASWRAVRCLIRKQTRSYARLIDYSGDD